MTMRRRVLTILKMLGSLTLAACTVAASVVLAVCGLSCVLSQLLPLLALIA